MAVTVNDLFGKLVSFDNLLLAARKARKGKRFKPAAARFNLNLEGEVLRLQRELSAGLWRPGRSRAFTVWEAKKRVITAAPYRDRVVHHAFCNVVEPVFERGFIFDTYANRRGKGTHAALLRLSGFCGSARYALKCDVVKYFDSMDRVRILGMLGDKISDREVLRLAAGILGLDGRGASAGTAPRTGIPIGNLTSQFFANVYLDGLDHFVKETLRCRRYVRYVDDFILLHDDKAFLHAAKAAIEAELRGIGLGLHPGKAQVFPVSQGVDFLGFKVFPGRRLLRRSNFFHFRRRLNRLRGDRREGRVGLGRVLASARSWIAHASWGDTLGLREKLFDGLPL